MQPLSPSSLPPFSLTPALCLYHLLHTLWWTPVSALWVLPIRLFSDSFLTFELDVFVCVCVCGLLCFCSLFCLFFFFSVNHYHALHVSLHPPRASVARAKQRSIYDWRIWARDFWQDKLMPGIDVISGGGAIGQDSRKCFRKQWNSPFLALTSPI